MPVIRPAAEAMVALARRLSPRHHDQGAVFVAMALLAVVLRSWPMLVCLPPYLAMHLCYGGAGTLQRPLREVRPRGLVDVIVVAAGVAGLAAYVALGVAVPVRWLVRVI